MILNSILDHKIKESISDLPKTVPLKIDGKVIGETNIGADGTMKSSILIEEEIMKIKDKLHSGVGSIVTPRGGRSNNGI